MKVTPAHDPNDFAMGERHDLEKINIFDETAHVVEGYGEFSGMSREECAAKLSLLGSKSMACSTMWRSTTTPSCTATAARLRSSRGSLSSGLSRSRNSRAPQPRL